MICDMLKICGICVTHMFTHCRCFDALPAPCCSCFDALVTEMCVIYVRHASLQQLSWPFACLLMIFCICLTAVALLALPASWQRAISHRQRCRPFFLCCSKFMRSRALSPRHGQHWRRRTLSHNSFKSVRRCSKRWIAMWISLRSWWTYEK